ncbi:MAG: hypothetical protein WC346_17245 [Methanogenium sp.]|jgi:hypothetical protein
MIIDLWTLLVVDMFQSFWMAVLAVGVVMYVIFLIGRVSQVTAVNYLSIYLIAMSIGYGFSLVSIVITLMVLVVQLLAIPRMINS